MDHAGPLVIGLLGAPGAGKSFVAAAFARLGAAVVDADALARAALDAPAVRDRLAAWWGDAMLDSAGRVDRKAVAAVVFNDPPQRKRLESLTHPLVREKRAALHRRFRADPAVGAIIEDSPLLLESGLDAGCDALVLVDAPLVLRQQRVAASRGWSAQELAQREKTQTRLDIKRRRADYVILNGADASAVLTQARDVLSKVQSSRL